MKLNAVQENKLSFFSSITQQRAFEYVKAKRVSGVSIVGVRLSGGVFALEGAYHKASIFFGFDQKTVASTECNCPAKKNCEHAAAVLLFSFLSSDSVGSPVSSFAEAELAEHQPTPPAVEQLLLGYSSLLNRSTATLPDERLLVYVVDEFNGIATVHAGFPRTKQDGRFAHTNLFALSQILEKFGTFFKLCEGDSQIAFLWRAILSDRTDANSVHTADAEAFNMLMSRILKTGRAYFSKLHSMKLRLGEARPGVLEWCPIENGQQSKLQMTVSKNGLPLHRLDWQHPWYLDQQTGEIGPIASALPTGTLDFLRRLPPLNASEAKSIPLLLAKLGLHDAIPTPPTAPRVRTERAPTKLSMTVSYAETKSNITGLKQRRPTLRLESQLEQTAIFTEPDGTVVVSKAAPEDNEKAIQFLRELGFTEIASAFNRESDEGSLQTLAGEAQAWQRLLNKLPKLKAEKWSVDEFEQELKPHILEEPAISGGIKYGAQSLWFDLEIDIELDGTRQPLLPLLTAAIRSLPKADTIAEAIEALNQNSRFVAFLEDGTLISLPFARVKSILLVLHELLGPNVENVSLSALDSEKLLEIAGENWTGFGELKIIAEKFRRLKSLTGAPTPKTLRAKLRPYQAEGLAWLNFLAEANFGGILADDMGLGKTMQILAHICAQKEAGKLKSPFLVVCPTTVLPNWVSEAKRFAPELHLLEHYGADRRLTPEAFAQADLIVTTYPIMVRDFDSLSRYKFHGIALDESQAIKNSGSQNNQAVCKLKSNYRFCVTGTPVENNLGELWAQFHFAMPGLLGEKKFFNSNVRIPVEKSGSIEVRESLARRIRPFVLRRTKENVAPELPDKITIVQPVELTKEQRDLYETIRVSVNEFVQSEIAQKGFGQSQIAVLKALLRLRQICCEPRLISGLTVGDHVTQNAGTHSATDDITLDGQETSIGSLSDAIIGGESNATIRSAKLTFLIDMLCQLCAEGRRILVFSQFAGMLDLIQNELERNNLQYVRISGQTKDRATPVEEFQNGKVPIFLISLKAGGTGLNLTAADTVIHYDPWWNPAAEDQATDRAHRIGQTKKVMVYKLIAAGTIEERMLELQNRKRKLADGLYQSNGARSSLTFTENELRALLQPLHS